MDCCVRPVVQPGLGEGGFLIRGLLHPDEIVRRIFLQLPVDKEQALESLFVRVIFEEESVERIYPSREALRVNAAPFGIVKG